MTRGVIYYNTGKKCLVRLATSIYSLRKHYIGEVAVLSEGDESHEYVEPIASALGVRVVKCSFEIPEGAQPTFLKKTLLHEVTPYDISVFIDSDSLVTGDISALFEWADKHQFVGTSFSNWRTDGRIMAKRIEAWKPYHPQWIKDALKFGPALNAGCYAYRRDAVFNKHWYDITLPGRHIHLPEETSMQVALPQFPHFIAPQIYNCSCKHSDPFDPDVRIIHYHRNKHCRIGLPFGAELWMRYFNRVMERNIGNIKKWYLEWDGTLRRYFEHEAKNKGKEQPKTMVPVGKPQPAKEKDVEAPEIMTKPHPLPPPYVRNDVTLVTAVSPNMIGIFKNNAPSWVGKPQFADMPLMVFVHGFNDVDKEVRPLVRHRNVKFIEWDMPKYEGMRELMISSFVLGTARYVDTPYFVKLDLDTYFSTPEDSLKPADFEFDVIGHRWGQSLVLYLMELDRWAKEKGLPGTDFLPPGPRTVTREREKWGHARFISWLCLHKTAFVKEAASIAGDRLPVPSHDTYLWYIAHRLGRKWGATKYNVGAGHSKRWKKAKAAYESLNAWGARVTPPSI